MLVCRDWVNTSARGSAWYDPISCLAVPTRPCRAGSPTWPLLACTESALAEPASNVDAIVSSRACPPPCPRHSPPVPFGHHMLDLHSLSALAARVCVVLRRTEHTRHRRHKFCLVMHAATSRATPHSCLLLHRLVACVPALAYTPPTALHTPRCTASRSYKSCWPRTPNPRTPIASPLPLQPSIARKSDDIGRCNKHDERCLG